jgi:hypothetical protein
MNNKIANIVVGYIDGLSWIDKLAGMTQIAKINQRSGETAVSKTFPISCQMAFDNSCADECYEDLMPNSKYKSVVYFEDGGFTFSRQEGNKMYYESSIRLVAWLNYKLIGEGGCGTTGDFIIDILKVLPDIPVNVGNMLGFRVWMASQVPRGFEIFSKYTFDEPRTQLLMLPYDYFALDLKATFYIIPDCFRGKDTGCTSCQ